MKNCKTCNNSFLETKTKKIFCSHPCQAKWAISIASKSRVPPKKKGLILTCILCNSEFYVKNYRKNIAKYCSRSCLAKIHLAKYFPIYGFKKTGRPHHKYKQLKINGKMIREHRYIMEQHLGRKLEKWEHVHHINDDPSDNRIENLEILSNSEHQKKEFLFRKSLLNITS